MKKVNMAQGIAFKCAVVLSIGAVYPVAAGPFDSILGGGTKTETQVATVSAEDLTKQLSALNLRLLKSSTEMTTAYEHTLRALGHKDEADKVAAEVRSWQGKNDLNTVERATSYSAEVFAIKSEDLQKQEVLDAEAKQSIVKAVPHYARGIANAAKLPGEYQAWAKNAEATVSSMKSNPLSAMSSGGGLASDLADVLEVTSNLPGLISTWSETTGNFIDLAKSNKVDTKGLASKI